MLSSSTFQITHNNAMKPQIVIYAGKGKLSETVQNLLFSEGITWGGNILNKSMFLDRVIYITVKWDSEKCELVNGYDRIVQDYSADTEMGKITEWLEWRKKEYSHLLLEKEVAHLRKWKAEYCELESKWDIQKVGQELGLSLGTLINPEILPGIQRLKREITQLRDELDAKSAESFPEGYDWHNPHGLTNEQIGVSEGWRLLLKEEINQDREPSLDLEAWSIVQSKWCEGVYYGDIENQTYRTKWPLPSPKNTPTSHPDTKTVSESTDDDFPTPDRQEKEAGLRYFLGVLNSAKKVTTTTSKGDSKYRQFRFDYGEMFGLNGELIINGDSVAVQFQDGRIVDVNVISIEMF